MNEILAITNALADPNRLRVFMALLEQEELCVCQIVALLRLSPATVSKHMSLLHSARLVDSRKSGRWVYFRLSRKAPSLLIQWLRGELEAAPAVAEDRERLGGILECDLNNLCRSRKQREGGDSGDSR